jgi:hypothetical protein
MAWPIASGSASRQQIHSTIVNAKAGGCSGRFPQVVLPDSLPAPRVHDPEPPSCARRPAATGHRTGVVAAWKGSPRVDAHEVCERVRELKARGPRGCLAGHHQGPGRRRPPQGCRRSVTAQPELLPLLSRMHQPPSTNASEPFACSARRHPNLLRRRVHGRDA